MSRRPIHVITCVSRVRSNDGQLNYLQSEIWRIYFLCDFTLEAIRQYHLSVADIIESLDHFLVNSLTNMQWFLVLRKETNAKDDVESTSREWDGWTEERTRNTDSDGRAGCPDGGRHTRIGDLTFHFDRSIRDRQTLSSRSTSRITVWRIVELHGTDEAISCLRNWSFSWDYGVVGIRQRDVQEIRTEQSSSDSDHSFFNDFVVVCGNLDQGSLTTEFSASSSTPERKERLESESNSMDQTNQK